MESILAGGGGGWGEGGFCFPSSQSLRRILAQKSGETQIWESPGQVLEKRSVPPVGWSQGSVGGNSLCSEMLWLSLAGAPAGTTSWPSMWNTGLPGGPHPNLRDSGPPFATGTSSQYWRPSLMGMTSDSRCQGLRGR